MSLLYEHGNPYSTASSDALASWERWQGRQGWQTAAFPVLAPAA